MNAVLQQHAYLDRFYQLYSFVSTLYVKNSKFYCVEFERKPAPRFVRFVRLRVAILRTVGTAILTRNFNINGRSIKPGTWNIPEHPGTSNNYDNYEKNV